MNDVKSEVVVIGPSTIGLLSTLGLGGCGMTVGVALVLGGLFGVPFLMSTGWIIVALVGIGAAGALVIALIRQRPRIEIGPDGFVVLPLFGRHSRRWRDIDGDFVAIRSGANQIVAYRLTAECKASIRFKPTSQFAGYDEAISGAVAVPINRLVTLLIEAKAGISP